MSGISTRIDKGQTRFAPKLKARPNRGKTTVSENGTPAPTQSVNGSDTGSVSIQESEVEVSITNNATTITAITTASDTSIETEQPTRRLSTVTPMSPPATQIRAIATPKSPTFMPSKVQKEKQSQGTAISFPSERTQTAPTPVAKTGGTTATSKKPTKGASIITVPTARSHTERDDDEESEDATESPAPSRKRSKAKATRTRNRANTEAEEEEEIGEDGLPDYSNTYMRDFTKDMGSGRRSKVYYEIEKMLEEKKLQKKLRRQQTRDYDQESRETSVTPAPEEVDELEEDDEDDERQRRMKKDEAERQAKREASTPIQAPASRRFAPQVRVIDGRIELDMDSLTVDHAVVDAPADQGPMEYVEESSATKFTNSASYSKKNKSEKWSDIETDMFYEALSQWGTDFGIIEKMFKTKSRIAVRNKFKREDRFNPSRVQEALTNRTPIDLEQYSQMTAKEYPEVTEADLIKAMSIEDGADQALLDGDPKLDGVDEEGEKIEEVVQEQVQEDEEEILGTIDDQL
ncbi:Transcription factor TFIIIB component B [Mortierella polycephala]|uniref:Transcription factor TFIIIB component B n=1 Tax=Mortierella polycephala TaxID=41804 RepID=A0A9P6PT18_9FUNG|nr:Transcription factor TFIIIB component B [Mortierella polycephala]